MAEMRSMKRAATVTSAPAGLVVRGMAAARQEAGLDLDGYESLECINLHAREELVLGALNGEHRAADLPDILLDAPVTRFLSGPGVHQPAKQLIGLAAVVACKARLEIAVLKVRDLVGDACNRLLLTEEMRGDRDDAADQIGEGASEGQRNCRAVGVSDKDRAFGLRRPQDLRQRFQGLVEQVVPRMRRLEGRRVAGPPAVVNQGGATGCCRKSLRDIAPEPGTAQGIVE